MLIGITISHDLFFQQMRQLKLYNPVIMDLKFSKNFHGKNSNYLKKQLMSKMAKSKKFFIVSDQKLKWIRKVQGRLQSKTSKIRRNLHNMHENKIDQSRGNKKIWANVIADHFYADFC